MMQKIARFKSNLVRLLDTFSLFYAFFKYEVTGKTSQKTGRYLINAFCFTGGRSNDWLSRLTSLIYPPRILNLSPQLLEPLSEHELTKLNAELQSKGYILLKQKLSKHFCDELLRFALSHPATLRQMDNTGADQSQGIYDPDHPLAVIYDFDKEAILSNEHVQALLIDPVILSIVQSYLHCEPVADMLSMWWSTALKGQADGEAAQLYHFDMDRIKWLKVFVYLTDVGTDNGPHYFVSGSQRTGGIHQELLKKGYVRLQDEEVARHYSPQDVIEVAAERGSILIEDTRGLHKGQHVRNGHRLILQFQFSNNRFGPETERGHITTPQDSALRTVASKYPRLLSGYSLNSLD
jgi:hypothetical protein